MKKFLCLLIFAAALCAQKPRVATPFSSSGVQSPLLGFAAGATPATLLPVQGAVGAGGLGDAVPFPPAIRTLKPAPRQRFALAEDGQGRLGLLTLDGGQIGDLSPIPGGMANADRIAFSPNGSSALLYSSTTQMFEVLTGLPAAPSIAGDFPGVSLGNGVHAIALSDDAAIVLAAVVTDSGDVVDSIGRDGGTQMLYTGASIAAIRFLPGSHDSVVADSQANRITLLSGDAFEARTLATAADGVNQPLDLETSGDGNRVFVANAGAKNIMIIDRAAASVAVLSCNFQPALFTRLFQSAVSVTPQDGNGVWVLDTDAANPWVAFAPRLHE